MREAPPTLPPPPPGTRAGGGRPVAQVAQSCLQRNLQSRRWTRSGSWWSGRRGRCEPAAGETETWNVS